MRWFRLAFVLVLSVALAAAPLASAFAMAVPADDSSHAHCGSMGSDGDSGDEGDRDGCSPFCAWACSIGHALSTPSLPALAAAQSDGAPVQLAIPVARIWQKAPIRPPIS